jgi:LemA protein
LEPEVWAAVAGLALVLPAAFLYNRLVADRNQARQGYADIDVQLKRRADLVPRLVETVRAYAAYERALFTAVSEARAAALAPAGPAERFGAERTLGAGLKQLVVLAERYPELKADASFRDLSARLVEVEDHLQFARRFYNGAVKQYVTRLESFPDLLVAKLFGFRPMPFFETDERDAVGVKL